MSLKILVVICCALTSCWCLVSGAFAKALKVSERQVLIVFRSRKGQLITVFRWVPESLANLPRGGLRFTMLSSVIRKRKMLSWGRPKR